MSHTKPTRDRELASWPIALAVKPFVRLTTRQHTINPENVPISGPAIIAANHISEIDPVLFAEFLWRHKRMPHFLAKDALFRIPVIGKALKISGQIPVYRGGNGADAMVAAKEVLSAGGVIVFYPEATLTRDPDAWPMKGKTGAIRLARDTGVPIIPVAQWGAMDVLDRYASKPKLLPPAQVTWRFGEPFSLEPYDLTRGEEIHRATHDLMLQITNELEHIRGPKPTTHIFNPAQDIGIVKPQRSQKQRSKKSARRKQG